MATKLENIWESMKSYDYETIGEIEDEMLCLLCKKLLVNAHSAPCGCRFCFVCVSEYLCENRYCPGDTEDCKLELISITENIMVDRPMNVKISKLLVKCPEVLCEFQSELRKMEDHIRMCNYQSSQCPYSNIGCDKSKISSDKISDHLQSEILMHTKLLIDFVGNFNNEMSMLKTSNNELREENKLLRMEINELKLNCERRQGEIAELRRESDEKTVDIICLKDENVLIRENVDKLTLGTENNKVELANLCRNRDKDSKEMKSINQDRTELRKLNEEFDALKLNVEQNKIAIRNKASTMEMSKKINNTVKNVDRRLLEMETIQNQMFNGEFVWRIENVKDKIVKAINGTNQSFYSKYFYSHKNGYNMCLLVYPDGNEVDNGTYLSVYFCLMKSDYDNILLWPFRHSVTLALINQRTKLDHVSYNIKCEDLTNPKDLCKPKNKYGNGIGFPQFISQKELLTNQDLSMSNQIFIKCTVNVRP